MKRIELLDHGVAGQGERISHRLIDRSMC